jgi:hypothetical protein
MRHTTGKAPADDKLTTGHFTDTRIQNDVRDLDLRGNKDNREA